jgi:hypothetical protein
MRVAILCNGRDLSLWQRLAIERIAGDHEIFVLACQEPPAPPRRWRHFLYYALNLVTIRNRLTRRVHFPDQNFHIAGRLDVRAGFDGAWAELPEDALAWLSEQRIDAVIKFGLGLLRVPEPAVLPVPILSFHHGDPRAYRGRPAGYYELVENAPFVGQVVQNLSNRLDSGEVVAFGESRAIPHSYRRTLLEAYALSPHLLPRALRAIAGGEVLAIEPTGPNYRLPGNWSVARFIARRWAALGRRLAYGALIEKQWNVASCDCADLSDPLAAIRDAEARPWTVPKIGPPFCFYADPFFLPDGKAILVEAMNKWSGKGEAVRLSGGDAERLRGTEGHLSYPVSIAVDGQAYLLPEISEWSAAGIYRLDDGRLTRVGAVDVAETRLIDPTPLEHEGRIYLFANNVEDGTAVLHLWSAASLFERFEKHPLSPVRVSAQGSRMGGEIGRWGHALYRLGQDSRGGYGDGILAFRIVRLSPTDYAEELAGEFAFRAVRGPHTVNVRSGRLLFDFYRERLSPLAGLRRLLSKV